MFYPLESRKRLGHFALCGLPLAVAATAAVRLRRVR
jgi:hypothetical protein